MKDAIFTDQAHALGKSLLCQKTSIVQFQLVELMRSKFHCMNCDRNLSIR